MGADRALPDPVNRGSRTARPSAARSLQWTALHSENRCTVALYAARPATVGSGLPADATLAGCFETLANDLRAVLRLAVARAEEPAAAILDSRTRRSSPESGPRAAYDEA